MPELVAILLRDHVPIGHRLCQACALPGAGSPHLGRPCALYAIADNPVDAAARVQRL